MKNIHLEAIVPTDLAGKRIDQVLAKLFPEYSRAKLTQWLKNNQITLNNQHFKPKDKAPANAIVLVNATQQSETWAPESLPLNIIYEDNTLIIINKPANLVVHPAQGNFEHTLVNALLFHCPALHDLPRAGLIHRLDKDTTGLLVIAKTLSAHFTLVKAMQAREIQRIYQAIVFGKTPPKDTIRTNMGRHPTQRVKMAVVREGKPAVTHYKTLAYYPPFSHLEIQLETGRTHQIRVHLAHKKFPIVGDSVYGVSHYGPQMPEIVKHFPRQALHAWRLSLVHPETQEVMTWTAPLPEDMERLLSEL